MLIMLYICKAPPRSGAGPSRTKEQTPDNEEVQAPKQKAEAEAKADAKGRDTTPPKKRPGTADAATQSPAKPSEAEAMAQITCSIDNREECLSCGA